MQGSAGTGGDGRDAVGDGRAAAFIGKPAAPYAVGPPPAGVRRGVSESDANCQPPRAPDRPSFDHGYPGLRNGSGVGAQRPAFNKSLFCSAIGGLRGSAAFHDQFYPEKTLSWADPRSRLTDAASAASATTEPAWRGRQFGGNKRSSFDCLASSGLAEQQQQHQLLQRRAANHHAIQLAVQRQQAMLALAQQVARVDGQKAPARAASRLTASQRRAARREAGVPKVRRTLPIDRVPCAHSLPTPRCCGASRGSAPPPHSSL